VEYAAEHAHRRHLGLRIVHAYDAIPYLAPSPNLELEQEVAAKMRDSAQRLLDDTAAAVQSLYPDLTITSRLDTRPPTATLLEESDDAETLVMGLRGSGGFAGLRAGSTSLHVASHARSPVVAVPTPSDTDPQRHGVVVGVDGSTLSGAAVEWAFTTADALGEPLVAVHTWSEPSHPEPGYLPIYSEARHEEDGQLVLAESLAGWSEKYPDVDVEARLVQGHPVEVLAAASATARLVVVGSHGRGSVRGLVLGSVSHGVLHHAAAPVAVVRRAT
jgi:nucleotide-binding universal stress UspA family protein